MKPLALLGAFLVLALSWRGGLAQTLAPDTCAAEVKGCTACTDKSLGCDTCSVGYVKDGTSCKSCGSGCDNCTTTNGTVSCHTCQSAHFIDNKQCSTCLQNCKVCSDKASCTTCEDGYRVLTSGQSCENCQSSCAVCDGPTKCRVCKAEYYLTGGLCRSCSGNCKTCESSTKCTACKDGYYKTSDDKCAACVSNCALCSTAQTCDTCNTNYFKGSSGLCLSCANCNSTCGGATACTLCDPNYFLQADGTCTDCPYNELDTNSAVACTVCSSSSNRVRVHHNGICDYCPQDCKTCSSPTVCTACQDKFYKLNDTVCLGCDPSCATCDAATSDNCKTCPGGTFLEVVSGTTGKCTACNTTCSTCSSATVCTACPDGRYLDGSECKACPTTGLDKFNDLQCTKCAGPYDYQEPCVACTSNCKCCGADLKCLAGQCALGYYYDAGACTKCHTDCSECSGAGASKCTSCSAGTQEVQTDGSCADKCAGHEYRNGVSTCAACNSTSGLGLSCIACSSADICTTCVTGEHLLANSSGCHNCSSYTTEATCTGGCFWNSATCYPCHDSCTECKDTSGDQVGDADECTSCYMKSNGRFFNNTCFTDCHNDCHTCYGPNSNQCVTCTAGRALQSDGTCPPCMDSDCSDCSGDKDFCNTCTQNKTAVDGSCVDCPTVTSTGLYDADFCNVCLFVSTQSTYGRYRPRTCARCADHCKVCTSNGPGKCDMNQCATGYFFESTPKTCRPLDCSSPANSDECSACSTTTTVKQWTGSATCINCPANCASCNNAGTCLSCPTNYVINANSVCVPCNGDTKQCTTCGTSTQGRYFETSGKKCYKCLANCLECTDGASCTTCRTGYYFKQATPECKQCSTNCQICVETSGAEECTRCDDRFYVKNKTCVACGNNCAACDINGCTLCDANYYIDGNKTCQPCKTNCKVCNPATTCTTCTVSRYYKKSGTTSGECADCGDSNCASCLNDTYCSKCVSTHYLDRTKTPACQSCGSNCAVCNDTLGCTVCDRGYYLDGNKACVACNSAVAGCAVCTSATQCTECQDDGGSSPVYRYLKSATECAACSTGCNNCTSENTCRSCSTNFCLFDEGSTQRCLDSATTSKHCLTCKEDTVGTDKVVTCLTCPVTRALKVCDECAAASGLSCKTCTADKTKCTGCYGTSFLSGEECKACPAGCSSGCTTDTTCTCAAANYFDTAGSPKQCKACAVTGCETCASGTTCSKCLAYHYDDSDKKCFYCKPGCYNCTKDGCTNCLPGHRLQQKPNVCKPCNVDDCDNCDKDIDTCTTCKRGYYLKSATECAECGTKCDTCADVTGTCTKCDAGYYLNRQRVCTLCTESGCGKCGLPPPTCTNCDTSKYALENSGCTKKCYVCSGTGCKEPTASQLQNCAGDNVCKISYTKNSAGEETYTRSCAAKLATETCDVFTGTNLPTRNCSSSENYCCSGALCNAYNCDSQLPGAAVEMRSCLFVLLSAYLLSLLANRIW